MGRRRFRHNDINIRRLFIGRFLYNFVIFTQYNSMIKINRILIGMLVFGLLFGCFFGINFLICCEAEAEEDAVKIRFEYGDKIWKYESSRFESDNFYFQSIGAKYGRWGKARERADLLSKVKKIGFSSRDCLKYVFVGIDEILTDIENTVNRPSKDAVYTFSSQNLSLPFTFCKEQEGYKVNFDEVLRGVRDGLFGGNSVSVKIKPTILKPDIYLDEIKHYATLRGSFYTSFNADVANRKNNISVAVKMFDGLVMPIGEEFSFNKITGRRSESRGYMPAKIIVDKKYVEGYGGGVCQVSTTLYNALLLSGLEIKEVHSHSLVSSYVNMGFDAMVNFGSADLRWVNNTETPLFVQSYVLGNQIHFKIYGAKQPNKYTYKRVTEIEKIIPPKDDEVIVDKAGDYADLVRYKDESAYQTLPKNGYRVRAILEIYDGEKLINRRLLRRVSYPAVRGVKVFGVKERPKAIDKVSAPLDKSIIDFWRNFG